ncbi:MAG: FxsA family protein, partial [Solirubrobacterales bacterium]
MALLLLILFLGVPIAEIYVIIQVGQAIGILPTLAILILDGFVGAALARSQGRAAWERFSRALAEGRVPARETADGAMIILGGALLLAPGFITDVAGIALLLAPTRALLRGG